MKSSVDNKNILLDEYKKKAKLVSSLKDARTALVHDGSSTDIKKISNLEGEYNKAVSELNDINIKLLNIQKKTEKNIEETTESIQKYRETLNNNHRLFKKYSSDIKNKMQLVATRDRMLQLSQERNMYKRKIIYVLFSIVIVLLISIISTYTIYGKLKK